MAWKNLKQRCLADALFVEHDAIKQLDSVNDLVDWSRIETLL